MFIHSDPVPRLYKVAAKALRLCSEGLSPGEFFLTQRKHKNKTKIFSLVSLAINHESELLKLINLSNLAGLEPRLDLYLARILFADLLWGKKILGGGSKPIETILKYYEKHRDFCYQLLQSEEFTVKKAFKPRYIRVNTLRLSIADATQNFRNDGWNLVRCTSGSYDDYLQQLENLGENDFVPDYHVKVVFAFPNKTSFNDSDAYLNSDIFLQDKATCLAGHILAPTPGSTILDMCAAPGMKTTHLAQLIKNDGIIYAVEQNVERFEILTQFVENSGATCVKLINKDVTLLDKNDCPNVDYVLLDPSCSGSGINRLVNNDKISDVDSGRLKKLSCFQAKLLRFALNEFYTAKRVVYSTCSLYPQENEEVVIDVLKNHNGNFRLVSAKEKLNNNWNNTGDLRYVNVGEKCIYAIPDNDYTSGFFIAVFERFDRDDASNVDVKKGNMSTVVNYHDYKNEENWQLTTQENTVDEIPYSDYFSPNLGSNNYSGEAENHENSDVNRSDYNSISYNTNYLVETVDKESNNESKSYMIEGKETRDPKSKKKTCVTNAIDDKYYNNSVDFDVDSEQNSNLCASNETVITKKKKKTNISDGVNGDKNPSKKSDIEKTPVIKKKKKSDSESEENDIKVKKQTTISKITKKCHDQNMNDSNIINFENAEIKIKKKKSKIDFNDNNKIDNNNVDVIISRKKRDADDPDCNINTAMEKEAVPKRKKIISDFIEIVSKENTMKKKKRKVDVNVDELNNTEIVAPNFVSQEFNDKKCQSEISIECNLSNSTEKTKVKKRKTKKNNEFSKDEIQLDNCEISKICDLTIENNNLNLTINKKEKQVLQDSHVLEVKEKTKSEKQIKVQSEMTTLSPIKNNYHDKCVQNLNQNEKNNNLGNEIENFDKIKKDQENSIKKNKKLMKLNTLDLTGDERTQLKIVMNKHSNYNETNKNQSISTCNKKIKKTTEIFDLIVTGDKEKSDSNKSIDKNAKEKTDNLTLDTAKKSKKRKHKEIENVKDTDCITIDEENVLSSNNSKTTKKKKKSTGDKSIINMNISTNDIDTNCITIVDDIVPSSIDSKKSKKIKETTKLNVFTGDINKNCTATDIQITSPVSSSKKSKKVKETTKLNILTGDIDNNLITIDDEIASPLISSKKSKKIKEFSKLHIFTEDIDNNCIIIDEEIAPPLISSKKSKKVKETTKLNVLTGDIDKNLITIDDEIASPLISSKKSKKIKEFSKLHIFTEDIDNNCIIIDEEIASPNLISSKKSKTVKGTTNLNSLADDTNKSFIIIDDEIAPPLNSSKKSKKKKDTPADEIKKLKISTNDIDKNCSVEVSSVCDLTLDNSFVKSNTKIKKRKSSAV